MGAFTLCDSLHGLNHSCMKVHQGLSHADWKPSSGQRFHTANKHRGMAIISRYNERLRYQKGRALVKDNGFQQQRWCIHIEHNTRRKARTEFLPDARCNVQFRRHAKALERQGFSYRPNRGLMRLGHAERHHG